MHSKYPLISFLFIFVLVIIAALNAALTGVFGSLYLSGAFGSGFLATVGGALYCLLILDIAGFAYIGTYAKTAETKVQRSITLTVGVLCLGGSILVTVVQLSNTAFGLSSLAQYQQTIEFIALVIMILLTAVHASVLSAYFLLSAKGRVKQKAIDIKADVMNDAMELLEAQAQADAATLSKHMSADMRRDILHELGFSETLKPVSENGSRPKVKSRT